MVDRQFSQNGVSISVIPSAVNDKTPEPQWITPEMEDKNEKEDKFQLNDHMSNMERTVLCLAELGGTAILVFLGCMGCSQGKNLPLEQLALTFGLAIMIGVQVFGHISGAHLNPAVTIAAATLGDFPLIRVPLFFLGQLVGSLAGYGLVKVSTPTRYGKFQNETIGLCSPDPSTEISTFQMALIEFILTFILIWVCCAIWDDRNKKLIDSVALRLGFTVAGLALAGGPYTGAHMNPARSFGPALLDGKWSYHWVYWIGPMCAGVAAALLYRIIFSEHPTINVTTSEVPTNKT
ncbi:unnamed protein product [Phaedon cochleariae]|uniref:Uncharacterized protein n=1 Tax=Phaedon cochleariae TaxID=80249 RepID=A0A9N9SBX6_PHACE|nr:unnamed protein product [Phaedon cochleariae]